jgi:hypothetical protein
MLPYSCTAGSIESVNDGQLGVELRPPLVLTDPPLSSINMEDTP